jgi:D-alanyl-D-alanine carboxypeptidase
LSNRNKKNIIAIAVLTVVLTVGIIFFTAFGANKATGSYDRDIFGSTVEDNFEDISANDKIDDHDTYITLAPSASTESQLPSVVPTPTPEPEEPFIPATELDLDPSSITVFVNKEYTLPKRYVPKELVPVNVYFHLVSYDERTYMRPEAARALEKLFAAAKEAGYELSGVSGYRSYARQHQIFTNNILTKGKEHTLLYSAVPGASEHQTGLAMDVSCKSLRYDLSTRFSETPEGIWLSQNAHLYGYIIRYPKGKGNITGYAYEPWHIRYVGKGLAKYIYENDLTLEEYYNYTPSKDFDFEAKYADLINITPSPLPSLTPSISPAPSDMDGIIIDENGEIINGEFFPGLSPTTKPEISASPEVSLTPVPEEEKDEQPTPAVTGLPIDNELPDSSDIQDIDDVLGITDIPDISDDSDTNTSNPEEDAYLYE